MFRSLMPANLVLLAGLCGLASGCGDMNGRTTTVPGGTTTTDSSGGATTDTGGATMTPVSPTNTAVNQRDRQDAAKTPIDQNENSADVSTTADIRRQVVATKMSVNAQNVKIITQDGKVTLRGPVATADEKKAIADIATSVAGAGNVDDQLEVTP